MLKPRIDRLLLPLSVALGLSLVGFQAESSGVRSDPPQVGRPVLVQRVTSELRVPERSFVGTIRPRIESNFGFRVQGKVAKRLINVGDIVEAGTALATLDETDLGLQIEQADAELSASKVALVQAEADLKRTITLSVQGWTPASIVDRQRATTEEVRSRTIRLERALSLARNAASYAVLRADGAGVVTETLIEPGQVISPGQAAIRVAYTAEREAVVAIPEALVSLARTGKASVGLWSNAGVTYEARLRELAPAADAMTRTYLARFSLPGADDTVKLGMTATITLGQSEGERVMRVPLSALINQGSGPAVWIVEDGGRLSLKPVRLAGYDAQDALITSGLAEGSQVVRLGAQKLDASQRVRIVDSLQF
ncbi:efflux RND transporter periplasmic adaptor subunit [Methylobacterium sp. E-065]|uniref:efflux RND transporter periplasmic adaptor subunit n=1 Tax=Methylobacterium sp. E-065 TaxID=2836583 RepID=UPI001FB98BD2|nr:efflux RND transporter periplasmic adaptor subunit [Methylobacterium sp. E-065]MCJ2019159.1 efflux RND transporter periplasmic adaptor subunit [Methylobacterium sp. E-065]